MSIKVCISRRLGELRWNQADLARATGIRAATINVLFHDFADRVSLEQLDIICDALNCGLFDILVWEKNKISKAKMRTGKAVRRPRKRT